MIPDIVSKNGFSLDRLATLQAVVDAGSIVAAAGSNTSRQSQFSRQIKELEKAMGQRLFSRVGKSLRPTEAGLQLVRMTKAFLEGVNALQLGESGEPETLKIGTGQGVFRWLVVPLLHTLRKLNPAILGYIRGLPMGEIVEEVRTGRLDVGIVHAGSSHEGVESELIGQISYVLTVPRRLLRSRSGEEVFSGRPIPYAELTGAGVLASTAAKLAREAGIRLNCVLRSDRVSLLLPAVEHEDVAAFLPAPAAATLPGAKFAIVPVDGSQKLNRPLVAVWTREGLKQRRALGIALRPLIRGLQQAISEFETGR